MPSPSTLQTDTAEPDAPAGEDWARSLAMRQLQVLGELAEQGLEVGRAIERQAKAVQPGDDSDLNALAMAHARVARGVRLTVMLQSRLIAELRASDEGAALKTAARAEQAARLDPAYVHKARVERIVERLARAEHGDDTHEVDRLVIEAAERLDDEDIYGDVLNRPVRELVALICRDLGLQPDWTRLAREAWAGEAIASGAPGSPFDSVHPGACLDPDHGALRSATGPP